MNVPALIRQFKSIYHSDPLVVRSPGRVNIIGEHTDYNNGFVLPAAIDLSVYVAVHARPDDRIELYANEFRQAHQTTVSGVTPDDKGWPNYILGVVDQLNKRGCRISGFNLLIDGDIPFGAGLSSSAAVECAVIFALNELFTLGLERMDMVKMAQQAEHAFAGVNCGIMDQFASMFGKAGHVIRLDCRSLEYEYLPLEMKGIRILLLNTNVKHALSSSEYNTRRQQCEQGVAWVKAHHPGVGSLRDVTIEMLDEHVKPRDPIIYRRCKYVVEENERLLAACRDLANGNIPGLGEKMYLTHEGLSKDYEVSCGELDYLVQQVRGNPAVLGARMMGGGFGGCTINLVAEEAIENLVNDLAARYKTAMGLELSAYIASIGAGTARMEA